MNADNWSQILSENILGFDEEILKLKFINVPSNLMMFGVSTQDKYNEGKLYNCFGHYYAGNGEIYHDNGN